MSLNSFVQPPVATSREDELAEVRLQLAEALETIEAIRNGEVDAVVVGGDDNRQVYTLETADRSYRLLIQQMTDGALMISQDDVVLYSNGALADMLHTSPGRLMGACFEPFVTPASRAHFRDLLEGGGKGELVLSRGDSGETFVAQLSLTRMPARDGQILCGVLTDLTSTYAQAREIAEAKSTLAVEAVRRESDERYRLILEGATDYAIMATDLDQTVTIWNAGAHQMLGWTAAELIGAPFPAIWTAADLKSGGPASEREFCLTNGRAEEERWHLRKSGASFWSHTLMMPLRKDDGTLIGFLKIMRDRTEQRAADEKRALLINELNHRVKNTLATVQSIAGQTLRLAPSTEEGRTKLEQRLVALSLAHDVLTRESWEGAELGEIVALAIGPYADADTGRVAVRGPGVRLIPRMALAIAMALQELATNAAKYGALSTPAGQLAITWNVRDDILRLRWEESGGPLVTPPERRGFGSRLIERNLAAELRGQVSIDFAATGVVCSITTELRQPDLDPNSGPVWASPTDVDADPLLT